MPTYARRQIVAEDRVGVYHCIARCVRRAFLCGIDPYTGHDFSHRKKWILDRVRELAGLFAVEVCGYSVIDPGRALRHAAGLDGEGTPRGQARGDSGAPGPDRGAAGAQSIELGGNGARIRSAVQAGGRAIELARRCRGALLAALVSGQGGGPNGLSVGQRLDAEP
jgi:hypothetical protein